MPTSISEEAAVGESRRKAPSLRDFVGREASAAGFDVCRIVCPDAIKDAPERLERFIADDFHGTMGWMAETAERRADPKTLWPDVKSIIMLGMNYGPGHDPLAVLAQTDRGAISVYAQNRDYHDVVKGKLKQVAGKLAARSGADVKVFVDTAPVMEKPLAAAAGLGWQGKHTNLVSRDFGSWLFLGSIFTAAVLEPDPPETDRCGTCHACLDICPTKAFPAPYRLDARRCISYLTIEHKGPIPHEFREAIGNHIYGCDDCLSVCPWNKFARKAAEAKLAQRPELRAPRLEELLELDDAAFRSFFSGSPVKRIGRDRFIRNVLIAVGNSGEGAFVPRCESLLGDPSPLVRGASVWALSRLLTPPEFAACACRHRAKETEPDVIAEWDAGMGNKE
jgi:epoxyqueuosine reductase